MDKKNITILILICVIIIGGVFFAVAEVKEKKQEINQTAYENGFLAGQINFYNQMLINLYKNKEIILPVKTAENTTINIKLVQSK